MIQALGFMVRDRDTGLLRNKEGGWSEVGKVWRKFQHLKAHFNQSWQRKDIHKAQYEIVVLIPMPASNLPLSTSLLMKEKQLVESAWQQYQEALAAAQAEKD